MFSRRRKRTPEGPVFRRVFGASSNRFVGQGALQRARGQAVRLPRAIRLVL